jgi:hypothetical protein
MLSCLEIYSADKFLTLHVSHFLLFFYLALVYLLYGKINQLFYLIYDHIKLFNNTL